MEKGKVGLGLLAVLFSLCLIASHGEAQPFILSKIADLNTPIPGGTGNFEGFAKPVISGNNVAFYGFGSVTPTGQNGIYLSNGNILSRIADLNTPIPEGTGSFTNFANSNAVIDGNNVVFLGFGAGEVLNGIYLFNGTTLRKVADLNTPIPGGVGNFTGFDPSNAVISNNNVAFGGVGTGGQNGIYFFNGTTLSTVADLNTPIPDGSGNFNGFGFPVISGHNVAFFGAGPSGIQNGIYLFDGITLSRVADLNTPIPGGTGNFEGFGGPPIISGSNVAFFGGLMDGIYLFDGNTLGKLADSNTSIPGGTGKFSRFVSMGISGSKVAFEGIGVEQDGIYLFDNNALIKVADWNTPVPGGQGEFNSFFDLGISGDSVVFRGFGIYLFNGSALSIVADLNTPIPDGSGNFNVCYDTVISGDSVAFWGLGNQQSGIYLASPHYYDLTVYVSQVFSCSGHSPCFPNLQDGIASPSAATGVMITQETYAEDVVLDSNEVIYLRGGWDTDFISNSSYTTINGSITITSGTMILENIILK